MTQDTTLSIGSILPTLERLTQTRRYTNIYNNEDFVIYNVQMDRKTHWTAQKYRIVE